MEVKDCAVELALPRSPLSPGTIKHAVQGQGFVLEAGGDESAEIFQAVIAGRGEQQVKCSE